MKMNAVMQKFKKFFMYKVAKLQNLSHYTAVQLFHISTGVH